MYQLKDYHFDLPQELIAQYPLATRPASRLMCLEGGELHRHFYNLPELLNPGDLLVFNDTKVIPARLLGHKTTGGRIEVLTERILSQDRMLAQIRASKTPRIGDDLIFAGDIRLTVINRDDRFYELQCQVADNILAVLESIGKIPLPPYMHREPEDSDIERYQTVYAKHKGSVAAPTAGFHFDQHLLNTIAEKNVESAYLTLHIGAGTFAPIRTDDITSHKMHAEYIHVSQELCEKIKTTKANGKRVIAVGTTSLRALESASQSGEIRPYSGDTAIFIYPGYTFKCVDALITNFHLPASTLLMLVCALGGYEKVMNAYRNAVSEGYRFYSYGDAMWLCCNA